uniref:helix-turn-helix domain-containing protein n=1 Tax=Serratia surfactantfaciens TaxID=2741499 RepID=UPI001B3C7A62
MDFTKEILLKVIEYVEENIEGELYLDTLSRVSGYSKWHLQKVFKKKFGMNLGAYIRKRRLSKAAILLKQSKLGILDISLVAGFCSQQAFSRSFKIFYGKTPSEFRKSKEWDFSKQFPPYSFGAINFFFYQVSMPIDTGCLK